MDDELIKIVTMKDDGGMTYDDIGDMLGLSGAAVRGRYRRWKANGGQVSGINYPIIEKAQEILNPEEILNGLMEKQKGRFETAKKKKEGQFIILDPPCAWANLSDLHLGGGGTDYIAINRDVKIIKNTEAMFAGFSGDGFDNWIVKNLMRLQRQQVIGIEEEWELFKWFLSELDDSLLYMVSGNHDNWTWMLTGLDYFKSYFNHRFPLYDRYESLFTLMVGKFQYRVKIRHSWPGYSIFNPTHGIEVGWERGGFDFEIGIGSHTHIGTMCRPTIKHGKKVYAVLTGTYKVEDGFSKQIGRAPSFDRGCGAFVFGEDGTIYSFFEDLEKAADVLNYLRKKAGKSN